jgi:hypothetical protein
MNTRPLKANEEANLRIVRESAGDFALLFLTPTGLEKGILDATLPFRTLLQEKGVHNFSTQGQGGENKVVLGGVVIHDSKLNLITLSLYRPKTKEGDPRFWPYGFTSFAESDDVFCIFVHSGKIHLLNLTQSKLSEDIRAGRATVEAQFFQSLATTASAVAIELLRAIREVAQRGPLRAVCKGDTAIGRSIETALGIGMNANRDPDYKGIELKSYRSTKPKNGLVTLFSKTPDWSRSLLKGSQDFLEKFGYDRKGVRRLYCSVHATRANAQGLRLNLNLSASDLEEFHTGKRDEVLAVWGMDTLHKTFSAKHRETFWISADTEVAGGDERFKLRSITHTKRPMLPQFDAFIVDGQICLDHTIKQKGEGAKDHGYLFRVRQERFTDLFTGEPRTYDLS